MAIAGSLTYDTKIDKNGFEKGVESLQTNSVAAGNVISNAFSSIVNKVKDFTLETINVGKQFDSSMSQVSAVSGATGKDLDRLRDKAKEMGASTKFTASEAADAFNYMAMAGWKTEDMLGRYRWNIKSSGSIWSRFSGNFRYCNRCTNSYGV